MENKKCETMILKQKHNTRILESPSFLSGKYFLNNMKQNEVCAGCNTWLL